jgi:PAS domain S-box-containing protein
MFMEETAGCERISNLLIVEDDESQLRTLTAIMQEEGFHVTGCSTASEAIEHLENLEAGVVVLDQRLPGLSGTQLLERLAAATDRIRVIINTAYSSYESAKDALNLGAFAYVEKAGDPAELLRHVHRACAASLRSYADQLKAAVAERTCELRQANESLKNEIAHRQNTQQALERERDKAQRYLDIAAVVMVAIDSEQRVGLINDKGCEILGYAEEEILGKNWFDNFLPQRVKDEVKAVFDKFVKEQADAPEYVENLVLTRDGRERLIAWHNTTLKDDEGNFVAILSSGEDITERRRADEALRQSEEKYKDLFENAREAILTFDPQGNITDVNKLVEDYGFKREELIGKSFFDYISEAHRARAVEDFETLISGRPVRGEMDVVTLKGTITVEYSDNPIFREGKVVGIQAILMDVTERKKAVDALKRQTLLSQVFLDSMPCVALLLRPQTREIVAANRQAEEIGAVPGTTCYGAWARRESACPWCLAPEVWDTGQTRHLVVEYEGIIWDAHWVPIEEDLYLHYAFDITQRTRVEEALRESEERYRLLFEGSLHPITIYDRDANIVMVNDIGARNLKKPLREIIGRPLREFIPEMHELTIKRVREVLESGEPLFVEDEMSLPAGKRWFLSTLHPVVNPKGRSELVQVISYDITERKRAEEKLFEYQAKLRAMASEILRAEDRERKRLALGLHDNICQRLVLTKLAVESSLPLVSNAKLAASLRIAAGAIGETIEEADSLTFELSSPVLREFGLVAALEKYLTEEVRRKHKIAYELESDEGVGALPEETKSCLFRVMRELLINAVKHARANKIKVSVHKSQGQLRLSVCDDGIGFKREEVNWEVSKKARFGLFSVREQLEYLGGSLEVESEPGRGTMATIVVPLARDTTV